ncbi:unnamed protein product, partial [Amoebophrya sp. A120]
PFSSRVPRLPGRSSTGTPGAGVDVRGPLAGSTSSSASLRLSSCRRSSTTPAADPRTSSSSSSPKKVDIKRMVGIYETKYQKPFTWLAEFFPRSRANVGLKFKSLKTSLEARSIG